MRKIKTAKNEEFDKLADEKLNNKLEKVNVGTDAMEWARKNNPFIIDHIYVNNAYSLKHLCERDIHRYVSVDEIAKAYYIIGFPVSYIESKEYVNGYTYRIGLEG